VSLLAGNAAPVRLAASADERTLRVLLVLVGGFLVLAVAAPLGLLLVESLRDGDGNFVGLANYARYAATPSLVRSLGNTLAVGLGVTLIVMPLAFAAAYALTRTRLPARGLLTAVFLLPIFAPSLLPAISLIYLFGNQGMLREALFGASIYGPVGIVMAQVLYTFPHALMILVTALSLADQRLYEAADVLRTSKARVFFTVTVPGAKYGLVSAAFVVFTLVVTDFGIAKVIGGQFSLLATDAYKQVVGQQNFQMGAVVGMILLVPALLAFAVDAWVRRRQTAVLSARAVPLTPKPNLLRDGVFGGICLLIAAAILLVQGVAVWASFIRYWPYNLSFTLNNYAFENFDPNGWEPFFNSLLMASGAAVLGTLVIFVGAYVVEKLRGALLGRWLLQGLALLPMAVPGLVLGIGYVFFINAPWNPLGVLYGTLLLLVINSVAHFYTVAHITAVTALRQIDPEIEAVSASLKVPVMRTFARVTVPISMPAILDIAVYLFVNAMTTVSAVVFLYGPQSKVAAVSIIHMDEAGATAAAAAMATVVMAAALAVKLLHLALDRLVFHRWQAWRRR
jgi:iron(III) transport system permease protein